MRWTRLLLQGFGGGVSMSQVPSSPLKSTAGLIQPGGGAILSETPRSAAVDQAAWEQRRERFAALLTSPQGAEEGEEESVQPPLPRAWRQAPQSVLSTSQTQRNWFRLMHFNMMADRWSDYTTPLHTSRTRAPEDDPQPYPPTSSAWLSRLTKKLFPGAPRGTNRVCPSPLSPSPLSSTILPKGILNRNSTTPHAREVLASSQKRETVTEDVAQRDDGTPSLGSWKTASPVVPAHIRVPVFLRRDTTETTTTRANDKSEHPKRYPNTDHGDGLGCEPPVSGAELHQPQEGSPSSRSTSCAEEREASKAGAVQKTRGEKCSTEASQEESSLPAYEPFHPQRHHHPPYLTREHRRQHLVQLLRAYDPDVVTLNEVNREFFFNEIFKYVRYLGYGALYQSSRGARVRSLRRGDVPEEPKNRGKIPPHEDIGNVILFHKGRFVPVLSGGDYGRHFHFGHFAALRDRVTNLNVIVACVQLTAGNTKLAEKVRAFEAAQVMTLLESFIRYDTDRSHQSVVVCGDFNNEHMEEPCLEILRNRYFSTYDIAGGPRWTTWHYTEPSSLRCDHRRGVEGDATGQPTHYRTQGKDPYNLYTPYYRKNVEEFWRCDGTSRAQREVAKHVEYRKEAAEMMQIIEAAEEKGQKAALLRCGMPSAPQLGVAEMEKASDRLAEGALTSVVTTSQKEGPAGSTTTPREEPVPPHGAPTVIQTRNASNSHSDTHYAGLSPKVKEEEEEAQDALVKTSSPTPPSSSGGSSQTARRLPSSFGSSAASSPRTFLNADAISNASLVYSSSSVPFPNSGEGASSSSSKSFTYQPLEPAPEALMPRERKELDAVETRVEQCFPWTWLYDSPSELLPSPSPSLMKKEETSTLPSTSATTIIRSRPASRYEMEEDPQQEDSQRLARIMTETKGPDVVAHASSTSNSVLGAPNAGVVEENHRSGDTVPSHPAETTAPKGALREETEAADQTIDSETSLVRSTALVNGRERTGTELEMLRRTQDFIFYDPKSLALHQLLDLPEEDQLHPEQLLPCNALPSHHLPLVIDVSFNNPFPDVAETSLKA